MKQKFWLISFFVRPLEFLIHLPRLDQPASLALLLGDLLHQYHNIGLKLAREYSESTLNKLSRLQDELEHINGWQVHQKVETVLSHMNLDADVEFDTLSAGFKRRTLLAKGLVQQPDILLLDEPTNHLDIDTINWLEDFLLRYGGTLVFVTHDRAFLQKLTTRIIELDLLKLHNWACDYPTYLKRKEALVEAEVDEHARFDKKLAQEEIWIRKGIKARRTRDEGRGIVKEYVGGYDDYLRHRKVDLPAPKAKIKKERKKQVKDRLQKLTFKENKELQSLPQEIEKLESEQTSLYEQFSRPDFYKGNGEAVAAIKTRLQAIEKELSEKYLRWEALETIVDSFSSANIVTG